MRIKTRCEKIFNDFLKALGIGFLLLLSFLLGRIVSFFWGNVLPQVLFVRDISPIFVGILSGLFIFFSSSIELLFGEENKDPLGRL